VRHHRTHQAAGTGGAGHHAHAAKLLRFSPLAVEIVAHIFFRLMTAHGPIFFRLPANIQGVHKALERDPKVPGRLKTREHAARVAWRICKDWVEAQLAMVEAEMADMVEVFLPYAQTESGETLYEVVKARGFRQLAHNKGADAA
jgi:hypothetical protein